MKFRKKPIVIEAIQWKGDNWSEVYRWIMKVNFELGDPGVSCLNGVVSVRTLEGEMTASKGDWIIRGVKGEFYPCKPDIFAKSYEEVDTDIERMN